MSDIRYGSGTCCPNIAEWSFQNQTTILSSRIFFRVSTCYIYSLVSGANGITSQCASLAQAFVYPYSSHDPSVVNSIVFGRFESRLI